MPIKDAAFDDANFLPPELGAVPPNPKYDVI